MNHWNASSIPKAKLMETIFKRVLIRVSTWLTRKLTSFLIIQEQVNTKLLIYTSSSTRVLKSGKSKTPKMLESDLLELKKMILHLPLLIKQTTLSDQHNMKRIINSLHAWKAKIKTLRQHTELTTLTYQDQEHIRMLNLLSIGFQSLQLHIKWDVELDYSNWNIYI